jgi:outer membrane protein OmpA-like peptidoglycan-associated protein
MDSRPQAPSQPAFTSRRRGSYVAAWLAGAALLASAGRAEAQSCQPANGLSTCVDADNLWASPGTGPFFAVAPTMTMPAGRASFGLALSYLSRPVSFGVSSASPTGTTIHALDNVIDATFLGSLGISDRFELTLAAPITLYQGGAGLGAVTGTKDELVRSAVRDFRFGGAFAILPRSRVGVLHGPALTLRLDFAAPTGSPGAFAGGATMTAAPSIAFDQRFGKLDLAAQVGARIRGESRSANAVVGTQIYYALGASYAVIPDGLLSVSGEAFALLTLAEQGPSTVGGDAGSSQLLVPAEWIASVTTTPFLAGDLGFSLGGGGPIPLSPEAFTTPRFRFNLGLRYAPTGHDRDGDGILDRDDKCPDVAEDKDGFQDDDGCPDPDNDGDGIPDLKDKCRDAAEDFDGFQDEDGCPDLDDDHDGIPDAEDKCRNEPEDIDGFQDEDGCPDPDNDGDGILDKVDLCPNAPEDFDGYKDGDGCPDPDNDADGIPDAQDQCPLEAEDKDGFQDADGCPDPDNDQDGVLDRDDRCPNEAETIDGVQDEDGCPEPGAKSRVSWAGDRVVIEKLARFAAGNAKLGADLEKQAKMAAQLVRGHAPIENIVIEAFPDRAGDTSLKAVDLAARRAEALKAVFVAAGLPADKIVAAAGDLSLKRAADAPPIEITARRVARVARVPRESKLRASPPETEKKP